MIIFSHMKFGAFLCVIFLCTACVSKEQQELQASEIAQQRFEEIDFEKPDSFPQFAGCDELENAQECFYQKLHEQINDELQSYPLDLQLSAVDTVTAIIKVSNRGAVTYEGLQEPTNIDAIDSLLRARLTSLTNVAPALKQGVPVESSYTLPIVLKPTQ